MSKLARVIVGTVAALCIGTVHATLLNRGNGMIYDTDLNITWYDDPNSSIGRTWEEAKLYVDSLVVNNISGWRLPTTPGIHWMTEWVNEGELGHLYYDELGNTEFHWYSDTDVFQSGNGFNNSAPFEYLSPIAYWTDKQLFGPDPNGFTSHVYFAFSYGVQSSSIPYSYVGTLAVHDGDVGISNDVPEPSTLLLAGLALAGLGVAKRRQTA